MPEKNEKEIKNNNFELVCRGNPCMYCDKKYDGMPGLCHVLINVKKFKDKQQEKGTVFKVIDDKFTKEKTEEIVEELGSGKYTHDYPLTGKDVEKLLGACVEKELPKEVYTLMRFYKMEARPSRPSVEYVPVIPR